ARRVVPPAPGAPPRYPSLRRRLGSRRRPRGVATAVGRRLFGDAPTAPAPRRRLGHVPRRLRLVRYRLRRQHALADRGGRRPPLWGVPCRRPGLARRRPVGEPPVAHALFRPAGTALPRRGGRR